MIVSSQPYQITSNNREVIIKLNRDLIEQAQLEQFLDYLSIKSMQQKSQLSEHSANALVNEINDAVWEKQKHLFET
jgi:hypothetical protein